MDWGTLWDWIDKIEPGNWSEWVGSILTAGSLLLGFSILRRDQLKDERKQAAAVISWFEGSTSGTFVVRIKNTSDLAVFRVSVVMRPWRVWEHPLHFAIADIDMWACQYTPSNQALMPGAELKIEPLFLSSSVPRYRVLVAFRDAGGNLHNRDISGGHSPKWVSSFAWFRDVNQIVRAINKARGRTIRNWFASGLDRPGFDANKEYRLTRNQDGTLNILERDPVIGSSDEDADNPATEIEPLDGRGTE